MTSKVRHEVHEASKAQAQEVHLEWWCLGVRGRGAGSAGDTCHLTHGEKTGRGRQHTANQHRPQLLQARHNTTAEGKSRKLNIIQNTLKHLSFHLPLRKEIKR